MIVEIAIADCYQENVQLSTGKRMHPFFTCWKASKRVTEAQAITKVEGRHWSALDGDFCVSCPVHVFDKQVLKMRLNLCFCKVYHYYLIL